MLTVKNIILISFILLINFVPVLLLKYNKCTIINVPENLSMTKVKNGVKPGNLWVRPGTTFKSISFQPVVNRKFLGTKDYEEKLIITKGNLLDANNGINEKWLKIIFKIEKETHLLRRNIYYIIALTGSKQFTMTVKLWGFKDSIKDLNIYVSGEAEISVNCNPQNDIKSSDKNVFTDKSLKETKNPNPGNQENLPNKKENLPPQDVKYKAKTDTSISNRMLISQENIGSIQKSINNSKNDENLEKSDNSSQGIDLSSHQLQFILLIVIVALFLLSCITFLIAFSIKKKKIPTSKDANHKTEQKKNKEPNQGDCNQYEDIPFKSFPYRSDKTNYRTQGNITSDFPFSSSSENEYEYEMPENYDKTRSLDKRFDEKLYMNQD